jgi:hypothetical protein
MLKFSHISGEDAMKTKSLLGWHLLLAFSFFLAGGSHVAHGQAPLQLDKLVGMSDVIVTGNVTNLVSQWDKSRGTIWTYVTIRCGEFLKGFQFTPEITIQVAGGEVDKIRMEASGAPTFQVGERVLVFLKNHAPEPYGVVGWAEGKYTFSSGRLMSRGVEFPISLIQQVKEIAQQQEVR